MNMLSRLSSFLGGEQHIASFADRNSVMVSSELLMAIDSRQISAISPNPEFLNARVILRICQTIKGIRTLRNTIFSSSE